MIRISLGSVGSGKTACEVREMVRDRSHRSTYTNIVMQQPELTPGVRLLTADMIVKKEIVGTKGKGDAAQPVYDLKLNTDFWKAAHKPLNIVLDEAHSILNSRRATSKQNVVMGDWLALIRRVLGSAASGMGELVFITQLPNRLDCIARDMASNIRYHVCHFVKRCAACGYAWRENSETSEPAWNCLRCGSPKVTKGNHTIQVWHFRSMGHFHAWRIMGDRSYHACYVVKDIEMYFPLYDTYQWDNLFSENY